MSVPRPVQQIVRTDCSGQLPEGDVGIATAYPRDSGITQDQDVVFADDFESYSEIGDLSANWDEVGQAEFLDLSGQTKAEVGGRRSLEMRIPVREQSLGNAIAKTFDQKHDVLFVRYYTRFDTEFDLGLKFSHTSCAVYGSADGQLTPGVAADGRNKLYAGLMTYRDAREDDSVPPPGELCINLYSPEQRYEWGDKIFPTGVVYPGSSEKFDFGPDFVSRPNVVPWRANWYCREFMVRANTPGQRDGRVAIWVDGKLVADFTNLRLRHVASL